MTDRLTSQLEIELDDFWNALLAGDSPCPETSEMETIERIASLDASPAPRPEFLDDLWGSLQADAPSPELRASIAPAAVQPIARPAPLRPPRAIETPPSKPRWETIVAALAALLAITTIGALLFILWRDRESPDPAAQRWSMTGGNPEQTNANPHGSPIVEPTVHWRTETNGRIESAVVVADGVVYIGNRENHLYALETSTGLQRWDANLRKPISFPAAVSDDLVVVASGSTLFGLDRSTGQPRWQRSDLTAASAPVIAGDDIFVVDADRQLRALALDTGEDRWTSPPFSATPAFAIDSAHGRLIATTPDGSAAAYAVPNGEAIWEIDPGFGELGAPLIAGMDVYVPIPGGVVRIESATGTIGIKNVLSFHEIPTLALAGDQLFASTDLMVVAYERNTLQVAWSNQTLSGLTGGLTVGASSLYLPTENRTLVALDRATGEVQWTVPLEEVAQAAPALDDRALYLATRNGAVLAIGDGPSSILKAPATGVEDDAPLAHALWISTGGPDALANPTGIAVSPGGEIWVCDTANDRLQIFDASGRFLRNFGRHGSAPGEFDFGEETAEMEGHLLLGHSCGLAFDSSGALYVADAANHRVQRFPASTLDWLADACCTVEVQSTPFIFPASMAQPDLIVGGEGTGDGQFLFASDVAVAPNGDIYVGDRWRVDVQRFDASGVYQETIGQPGNTSNPDSSLAATLLEPGAFIGIDGIAIDTEGRLYVADDDSQEVERLERDGSWTVLPLSRSDYRINGIAVDDRGNLFIAQIETIGGSFRIYDADGKLLGRVGSYGNGLGQFDATSGLALDGDGHIYVTDWAGNRFQKFELDHGEIDALATATTTTRDRS